MEAGNRPYVPISCQEHDRLLALATLGQECEIEFGTEEGDVHTIRGVIEDVYTRNAAEYLRLRGGRILRLDQLQSLDGRPVPPA